MLTFLTLLFAVVGGTVLTGLTLTALVPVEAA
jgi:hypothetical protein